MNLHIAVSIKSNTFFVLLRSITFREIQSRFQILRLDFSFVRLNTRHEDVFKSDELLSTF